MKTFKKIKDMILSMRISYMNTIASTAAHHNIVSATTALNEATKIANFAKVASQDAEGAAILALTEWRKARKKEKDALIVAQNAHIASEAASRAAEISADLVSKTINTTSTISEIDTITNLYAAAEKTAIDALNDLNIAIAASARETAAVATAWNSYIDADTKSADAFIAESNALATVRKAEQLCRDFEKKARNISIDRKCDI